MKYTLMIAALFVASCSSAPKPVQQNANSAATADKPQSVLAHSGEPTPAPSGEKPKWTQSGEPIDTTKFDTVIVASNRALNTKPGDESLKKAAAKAYFDRGFALTEARQYASALGDYRKALKLNPADPESKKWIEQIIKIYDGIGKSYPKEGEEPPALPFAKPGK